MSEIEWRWKERTISTHSKFRSTFIDNVIKHISDASVVFYTAASGGWKGWLLWLNFHHKRRGGRNIDILICHAVWWGHSCVHTYVFRYKYTLKTTLSSVSNKCIYIIYRKVDIILWYFRVAWSAVFEHS